MGNIECGSCTTVIQQEGTSEVDVYQNDEKVGLKSARPLHMSNVLEKENIVPRIQTINIKKSMINSSKIQTPLNSIKKCEANPSQFL